ncbi:TPA: TcdA/TcdB catalytic glycosyltransferase domain-containing protein [Providencia alcalifaciens]
MRVNSAIFNSPQEHKTTEINNTSNDIGISDKSNKTYEPFINRITKINNASTDDVVAIGGFIQDEIRKTLNPTTNQPPLTTSGNWKTAILYRVGLLMSGHSSSSTPLINRSNNVHLNDAESILNKEPIISNLASFEHVYNTHGLAIPHELKMESKVIKKRSLKNGKKEKKEHHLNNNGEYSLTSNNILDKIHNGSKKKHEVHPELIGLLKQSIERYLNLNDKNSREGIEMLKQQANTLYNIHYYLNKHGDTRNNEIEKNNIIKLIAEVQDEYKSHKVEIEKHIHIAWIAGAPPESIERYAKAYKNAYPNFTYNFWIDSHAMLASVFNKELRVIAFDNAKNELLSLLSNEEIHRLKNGQDFSESFNIKLTDLFERCLFKSVLQVQDSVMNYAYIKGLLTFNDNHRIKFLKDILNYDAEKIKKFQQTVEENNRKLRDLEKKLIDIFGKESVNIKDVNELPEMQIAHRKQNYQQELILRGNYAAATDMLRAYILKNHGGIYADYDVIPNYTPEVYKIVQDNCNNFDFLEKEDHRRALSDEILSLVSNEPSAGLKHKLPPEDIINLDNIISKLKIQVKESKIFSPIDTKVIRDSMMMHKSYQLSRKGWNIRGNNNFLVTHKDSKVMDFVIAGQENTYREILGLREQLRTEGTGEQRAFYNPNNNSLEPLRGNEKVESKLFVSDLESNEKKSRKKEILKSLDKDLKEYGQLLTVENQGVKKKDIRATQNFLKGYKEGNAINNISGFKEEMNIHEIVSLMKKNYKNLSEEQKGTLAYEVEKRALAVTFQPRVEEYHQLFDKVKSNGELDPLAKEKLIPQLFLLNLVGDGFGGRCDPLSMLLLSAKYQESLANGDLSSKFIENLYSAAAVLSESSRYTETEIMKAKELLNTLVRLHAKNPMLSTDQQVWKEKKEKQTLHNTIELLKKESIEPILLKLEAPGHAMAAWAVGKGENRIYGFYDPNGGFVEFSDIEKFSHYFYGIFENGGLDKGKKYHLNKDTEGRDFIFERVVILDGEKLSNYKTGINEKPLLDILKINVFEPEIRIKQKKEKFSPKKYYQGSLFSHYRMDGIIPQKYSTLDITGPDAMMNAMKKYYESLGELGRCRLEQHNNKFKGLDDDSFVGNLKEVVGASGQHYDWINQKTVGINDITPDDESTWVGKKLDIKEVLTSIESNKQSSILFDITPTKLNLEKLQTGWPSELVQKLKLEWPDFEYDYNKFIGENILDLNKLSDIDKKIHKHLLTCEDSLVKWTGLSLSEQLTKFLHRKKTPINNQVHYLSSDFIQNIHGHKKSISSILASNINTKVSIWRDDFINKLLVAKEFTILKARENEIIKLFRNYNGTLGYELELYYGLKRKSQLGIISHIEKEKLAAILQKIAQDKDLESKLIDIEIKIKSLPIPDSFNINGKIIDPLKIKDINELKYNVGYNGDIITLWNKYITSEQKVINSLLQEIDNKWGKGRVEIRKISNDLNDNDLIKKMINDRYGFDDFYDIVKHRILSQESGVMMGYPALAAPSTELIKIISDYTGGNDTDTIVILKKLYNYLFGEDIVHFGPSNYEQSLKVTFESILDVLDKNNISKYFLSVMNQDVSALGVRYSSIEGKLTSDIMMAGMKDGLSNNIVLDRMEVFLGVLYDIKTNKDITLESIKSKFNQNALGFMLQNDAHILEYLKGISTHDESSLSDISRGLTGKNSFLECALYITQDKFPSITNNLLKEIKSKQPSVYSIADPTLIEQSTLKGLGYGGSDNYLINPIAGPKLHDISIQAKYNALKWGDFYGRNALLWQDAATKFDGKNIKFHPQILLTPQEGRCMGLAELYLLAKNENHYDTLQENLELASALYQESLLEQSQLSQADKHLLTSMLNQIEHAQQHGNNKLLQSKNIEKIRLSDFEVNTVADYLSANHIKKLLITTNFHSIVISIFEDKCRVTDPNFGSTDFTNLEKALNFVESSIHISPEVRELYSGKAIGDNIDILFMRNNHWESIVTPDVLNLSTHHYQSTVEKIKDSKIIIKINDNQFNLFDLYKYGIYLNGARIDENINKTVFNSNEINKLNINERILKKYIDEHHLTAKEHDEIKLLVETLKSSDGEKKLNLDDVFFNDIKDKHFSHRVQRQSERVGQMLSNIYSKIRNAISSTGISQFKVKNTVLSDNSETIKLALEESDTHKVVSVDIDISDLKMTLREGLDALSEGVDNMNLDGVMAILGIIQYVRLTHNGDYVSTVDHANLGSDIKTVTEKIVGTTLMFMGNKKFGTSISDISLEGIVSQQISQLATKIGGSTGKALSHVAKVIRFPILDTALNLWSLGESIQSYLDAKEGSLEKTLAEVDIAFASTYSALTLSSIAFPPIGLAAFPLMFLQQEIRNFQMHLYHENARRASWLNIETFFNQAAESIVNIDKYNGVIDLSSCQIVGNLKLDLTSNPPILTGIPSCNYGKNIGNKPNLSDEEVRKISQYAISCVNKDEVYIPNIFGNSGGTHCRDLSSESNLVKGFANRNWPSKMPLIPAGDYNTAILGYTAKFTANTEVIRMTWNDFQEVSRENYQAIEKSHKHTKVIAGDKNLRVIVPALDRSMFSPKNEGELLQFADYSFDINGGIGGVTVYANGVGHFTIRGENGTKNTISFGELPKHLNVHLDLNKTGKQDVVTYNVISYPHKQKTLMTLIHDNINTVVGSNHGKNTFLGNNQGNHFIIGQSGANVYLGGGSNVITIPSLSGKSFIANIYLTDDTQMQYLQFGFGINKIFIANRYHSEILFYFDDNTRYDEKTLMIHAPNKRFIGEFLDSLMISTADGLELGINKSGLLFARKINVIEFSKYHKYGHILTPKEVLQNAKFRALKGLIYEFDYSDHKAIYERNSLIYKGISEGCKIKVSDGFSSVLYGSKGGEYIFYGDDGVNYTIYLYNDNEHPETINLSDISDKIKVTAYCKNNKCILKVFLNGKYFTLVIKSSSIDNQELQQSHANVIFNEDKEMKLSNIFKLCSYVESEIVIYN